LSLPKGASAMSSHRAPTGRHNRNRSPAVGSGNLARDSHRQARSTARSPWLGYLGRAGLAAQGVCFGIIGGLAIALAVDAGGMATEPQGALNALARQGWGVRRLVPPEAAIDFNPSAPVGIGGALSKLANASYGTWLLGRHRRRLDRLRRL
jgi:hypothetical protein